MNKKIYFNNKFIEFAGSETQSSQNQTIKIYEAGDQQTLKIIIDNFLHPDNLNSIRVLNFDFETVFNYFKNSFSYIEAAGGFVEKNQHYLFIHRLGKWDLPKGKLDAGETIEIAALRECEEECAVRDLKIIKQLSSTFHIYSYKNGHALKQTFWFYMQTNFAEKLIPQAEENIDAVLWFSENEVKKIAFNDTYLTIKDVIIEAIGPVNTENHKN
ncbi:MAG: NUDIX domain-containing protein [Bacteroidia bacterium]